MSFSSSSSSDTMDGWDSIPINKWGGKTVIRTFGDSITLKKRSVRRHDDQNTELGQLFFMGSSKDHGLIFFLDFLTVKLLL